MNKTFLTNIGDLVEIQRSSFYRFLYRGISEDLINFPNPFIARLKLPTRNQKRRYICFVYLYINEIKIKGPKCTIDMALKKDRTYGIKIYVKSDYSYEIDEKLDRKFLNDFKNINPDSKSKKIIDKIRIKKDIYLGEIPLMTEEGTFIINGCERVIINQIIRSPGIYFRKEFTLSKKVMYTATLISDKGMWTKIILDEKLIDLKKNKDEQIFQRIYMRLSEFKSKFEDSENKRKKKDKYRIYEKDQIPLLKILTYFGLSTEEVFDSLKYPERILNIRKGISTKHNNDKKQSKLQILIKKILLNQRSGCFSIGLIGRYKINKRLGLNLPNNITYLTSHDLIKIIDLLVDLKYYNGLSDDIDHIKNKQVRSIGELLQNQFRIGIYRMRKSVIDGSLIPKNPIVNYEDNKAVDWILDPRGIHNSIREFFNSSQLSQYMDQINPLSELTHKRKVTLFGPNGLKRDHISTIVRDIHPSQYGKLCPVETPEGQNAGMVASLSMFSRVSSLGWIETPYFLVKNSEVFSTKRPIFLNPEEESKTKVGFADILLNKSSTILEEYISIKENYSFSVTKRNQLKYLTTSPLQLLSLATTLIPFVEHDDANRALMGSNMQRQAVPLLWTQKPIIGTGLEVSAILNSGLITKSYTSGTILYSSSSVIKIKDKFNQTIEYYLRKYSRSNQDTCINQKPIVWLGEEIYAGQIIADGPGTNDGELALGRNLTIAYMPWEGYNYEDAIILNERIIIEDCLTSIHIEEYETTISYSTIDNERLTTDLPHLTQYVRRFLGKDGIVKIGAYVKEHDILVGKVVPYEEEPSAQSKLYQAIFGKSKKPSLKDTSLKVTNGSEGRVIDVRVISTKQLNTDELSIASFSEIIKIYIAQVRKVQIGDKLAGRHGNKGIISRILPRQDMPYLPDGTPIDILFNPLGVPSRMNVGQVLECLLGLAGQKLGKRFKVIPFDEIYGKEASRILVNQKLKEASLLTNSDWLFNDKYPGKILLRDGRTGEFFDNPITVGKSYILKLIHLVEDKIHARATGPYSLITEQPLAGKAQKGGQRFGEMEVWALEAYGCSHTLQELLTIKSDDIDGRNDMYESILVRLNKKKPSPSIPETFLVLIRELQSLGLDFIVKKVENSFNLSSNIEEIDRDLFKDVEKRLYLRALLSREKSVQIYEKSNFSEIDSENSNLLHLKEKEKERIWNILKNEDFQK